MPTGSFDLDSTGGPIDATAAVPIAVFWYDGSGGYSLAPNVVCVGIDYRIGPEPAAARFRYRLDSTGITGWPSGIEQIWPLGAQGPYVGLDDDRLVVAAVNPDGSLNILWDGFAQAPQADLGGQGEHATFTGMQVSARVWDVVTTGRIQRSAAKPGDATGKSDQYIDEPARFNPSSQGPASEGGIAPNASSYKYYTTDALTGLVYPVFEDPLLAEADKANGTNYLDPWKTSGALKYLLGQRARYLAQQGLDEIVQWPTFDQLQALLASYYPGPGSDVLNPSTWQTADMPVRDYDASGKALPAAVADLLGYAGFDMAWSTDTDGSGNPVTLLSVFRRDAASTRPVKAVYVAPEATPIDLSTDNAVGLQLTRDSNAIINAYHLQTRPQLIEATVLLAPLFTPVTGDNLASNRAQFLRSGWSASTTATVRRKYRWYGADECGVGHYNSTTQMFVTGTPLDLTPISPKRSNGTPTFIPRYRPGGRRLIALDTQGRPLHAVLEISENDPSQDPALRVPPDAFTWNPVTWGWDLLGDRLGIEVTSEDPEQWNGGKVTGDLRGISWVMPGSSNNFTLRLTTVIELDRDLGIVAPPRVASPTSFARWRSSDGRDHFQQTSISPSSVNYTAAGGVAGSGKNVVVRDDTKAAQAHADGLRSKGEMPAVTGTIQIPYLTTYYQVGDRISGDGGRGISFQANIAADQGESPTYPIVVGVSYQLDGGQRTILHLNSQ